MGQFQNYSPKNKKSQNNWNWYIILLAMICIGTLIDLLKKTFPDANTVEILTFYGGLTVGLGGAIGWYWRRRISTHPFKMEFFDKEDAGKAHTSTNKNIEGIHGLFRDHLTIRIKLKKERNFEQINIRLVEKKYFGFIGYKDTSNKMVSIERINDIIVHGRGERKFKDGDDSVGGRDGYYNPPYYCPKDDYLWYQIKLKINPDITNWSGYIGFQHRRGDANRAYAHCKLTITNTDLKD